MGHNLEHGAGDRCWTQVQVDGPWHAALFLPACCLSSAAQMLIVYMHPPPLCPQALGESELKAGAEEVVGRLRRRSVQVRRGSSGAPMAGLH